MGSLLFVLLFIHPITVLAQQDTPHLHLDDMDLSKYLLPFYTGNNCTELIQLCRLSNGDYNYESPNCIANQFSPTTPPLSSDLLQHLKEQRRNELKLTIQKVTAFIERLERNDEFTIQLLLFFLPLIFGIHLIVVGHFNFRTLYDTYSVDASFGMPCWQYIRMKYAAIKVADFSNMGNINAPGKIPVDDQSKLDVDVKPHILPPILETVPEISPEETNIINS